MRDLSIKRKSGIHILMAVILWAAPFLVSGLETLELTHNTKIDIGIDFRTYGINDQRIYWSGVEFSFGAEAAFRFSLEKKNRWSTVTLETEFLLNQPFGDNILLDEFRDDYKANFTIEKVEMSRMSLRFDIGDFSITMGKTLTPFGRTSFISHSNNFGFGAPFIRSESIIWRETGIFLHWENRFASVDVAAVNGEEDRDTNSGKAGIFRVGFHGRNWRIGASHKIHDGTGSEWQKQFKGHSGVDMMISLGRLCLSGEWITDKYGFHRPFDPSDIFWPRSLYYRDIFYRYKTPVTGKGWYLDLGYRRKTWMVNVNYGEYHPQEIGNIFHDLPIKRAILRMEYRFLPEACFYFTGLLENDREKEAWSLGAKPFALLLGCEYRL